MATVDTSYERWITSRRFWLDTFERVVRTVAQVTLAVLGAPFAMDTVGLPFDQLDGWQAKAAVVAMSAGLTFLTALAGRTTGDPSTASLTSGTQSYDVPR